MTGSAAQHCCGLSLYHVSMRAGAILSLHLSYTQTNCVLYVVFVLSNARIVCHSHYLYTALALHLAQVAVALTVRCQETNFDEFLETRFGPMHTGYVYMLNTDLCVHVN